MRIAEGWAWLKRFLFIGVGLMFGVLAAVREIVNTFASHPDPLWQRKFFWMCVWIACFAALAVAWFQKNREYRAEASRNQRAEISGAIKEVFVDSENADIKAVTQPSGETGFEVTQDLTLTISVFVKNLGAPTTIEHFRCELRFGERTWQGHKLPLQGQGFYVQRDRFREPLEDIEQLNDTPLEHTRNGWLRFRVHGAVNKDGRTEIAINAIDKLGVWHDVGTLQNSAWKRNSSLADEQILRVQQW